jgi:hypothetical protein
MFFCPNCNNTFNITKQKDQKGGTDKYETIIKKIINNEAVTDEEVNDLVLDKLKDSQSYKKLKIKDREYVFNKINELLPLENKQKEQNVKVMEHNVFFICTNCGFKKPIEDGTCIFSRTSPDISQSYTTKNVKNLLHSDILPRTRKYECPNKECNTHKHPEEKEAIFFRINNTYAVSYICTVCETTF